MATISVSLPSDGTTADAADYNTPITTIVNEINGGLDNDNIKASAGIAGSKLADNAITTAKIVDANVTAGKLASASVTPDKLATGALTAYVATSQTTTSTSFTDLATTGPAVTATIGANGLALVTVTSHSYNSGVNDTYMGFAVSGSTTVAAADEKSKVSSLTSGSTTSGTFLVDGLTPGSNTFTAKYKVQTGTGTFLRRTISVVPL